MRAAMVGTAGYAVGKRAAAKQEAQVPAAPSSQDPRPPASQAEQAPSAAPSSPPSEAERVDALTKLKGLFDSGVLTQEQYEAEKQKLLQGM